MIWLHCPPELFDFTAVTLNVLASIKFLFDIKEMYELEIKAFDKCKTFTFDKCKTCVKMLDYLQQQQPKTMTK